MLVLEGKGAVHPVEEATERNADTFPAIADRDAGWSPGDGNESDGNGSALREETVDEGERTAIAA